MIDLKKLPAGILGDLREFFDVERDSTAADERIAAMGDYEMLDAFLRYNGIINTTDMILNAVDAIRQAHGQEAKDARV